ncbi:MAG TPA: 16S rRNA (guanine(527)-N(7))-methyltransferase RsmG [Acidobacteriaceae bacterium]|nr:16S rRNA (guanine(527)-N(7))-methyltransferase RsmG [Acidobacteriaceae bacterium]
MTPEAIATLIAPYIADAPAPPAGWPHVCGQLATYLDLLLKWNARTNLTAIRDPEEIVRRHFGESLFAAQHIGNCNTLLDFGSGAGFPGIPIQLLHPNLHVTLAESQGKKAAFLREAVRTLSLPTKILAARVETLPPTQTFQVTTLRAVDKMHAAIREAATRTTQRMVLLATLPTSSEPLPPNFESVSRVPLPNSQDGILEVLHRCSTWNTRNGD